MVLSVLRAVRRLLRSAVFLLWLCGALAFATVSSTIWAVQAGSTAAVATAKMTQMAAAHRKEMRRAVARTRAKTRAKARLKRGMTAIPVIGLAVAAAFEEQEYRDWRKENPGGTRKAYVCESAALTAEVLDEVLASLPERLRPGPDTLAGLVPECGPADPSTDQD